MKTVFKVGMKVYDSLNFPNKKGFIKSINMDNYKGKYPIIVEFKEKDKNDSIQSYTIEGVYKLDSIPTLSTKPYEIEFKGFEQKPFRSALEDIEEIKERLDALKKLTTIRDCYNEGWEPNWNDNNEKYTIKPLKDKFMLCCVVKEKATLYFKSIEIATKFFEEQRKLLEIAKPLL